MSIKIDEKTLEAVNSIKSEKPSELSKAEVAELTERFKGMSQAEMELFIDIVPIDLCLNRIHKELDRAKEFEMMIKSAMTSLK